MRSILTLALSLLLLPHLALAEDEKAVETEQVAANTVVSDPEGPETKTDDIQTSSINFEDAFKPYIERPHDDGTFRIYVMGDSLGAGAWQGLFQNFKKAKYPAFDVVQKAKVNTGIVRSDRLNWPKQVEKLANARDFQIAVMLFGGNDMQTIRTKGKAHHYKTDGWVEQYGARLDTMITELKDRGVAVYWMGLPIVKKKRLQEDYTYLNEIFKQKAEEHGIRYVDTWGVTADDSGRYSQQGLDLNGKKTRLRARDGVHFTPSGYRVLARYVEDAIKADLEEMKKALGPDVVGGERPPVAVPVPRPG